MKPVWLVGAVALAAFLIVRRRRLEPTLLVGGAIGVVGALIYGAGVIELPNLEKLIEDAGEFFGKWTYAVVPVLAFLETGAFVGLLTPGETFMVFGGVVAGQGRIDLVTLIGLTWTAAVLGDVASFYLGRRLGRQFLERHGAKVQITEERLQQVDRFYDRHGGKAILLGRFVGLVRAVSPFLAGSGGMAFRRFIPYDVIGAGLWSTTFLVLGYIFWQRFGDVLNYAERGAFAFGTVIVVVVGGIWAYRWLKLPEHRHRLRVWINEQLDRPALRPLAVVLRPAWRVTRTPRRFVWARITPGDLGLEITTLLAVLSVSTYAVLAPLLALRDGRTPAGDLDALELGDELRHAWLNSAAEIVTALGALPTVAAVVALAAILLSARGAAIPAFTLIVATALTVAAVTILKDAEDRPRPSGTLVETTNAAFPSGHSAYAVAWVAVAVALTRVFPGALRGTFLVLGSVVLVVLVGATRVYLRAHWLSDVTAGIGLGAGIFALCGMGALVVAYVRNNPRAPV